MNTQTQAGISTLQIIIALAVGAVALGLISLLTGTADETTSQQVEQTSEVVESDTPLEAFAGAQAELIAAPAIEAVAEKNEAIEAEMDITVENEVPEAEEVMELEEEVPESEPTPEPVAAAGTFADYDPSLLVAGETNVLFFHADWCPSCRGLENDLNANLSAIPAEVNILKLDYDTETELKKEYGVIRQHTLVVVDGNGTEIKKLTGLTNTLDQVVNQL